MERTRIICTIGPASSDTATLSRMATAGMRVARINLSHASQADSALQIERLRQLNANVAILVDTCGPEIRTGVVDPGLTVIDGQEVWFSAQSLQQPECRVVPVDYDDFYTDAAQAQQILIDNGELWFDIIEHRQREQVIVAKARNAGQIYSHKHVSLPGVDLSMPSITAQDWSDIRFALSHDVDFLALSFVRTAQDVLSVRELINQQGRSTQIVAKIETRQAVENITDIIDVSDAIMVARGDLCTDVPFEQLGVIQDMIVAQCQQQRTPVIVATGMLNSIAEKLIPSRAEIIDVTHAVTSGADYAMLSEETAVSANPERAVRTMASIIQAAEQSLSPRSLPSDYDDRSNDVEQIVAVSVPAVTGSRNTLSS